MGGDGGREMDDRALQKLVEHVSLKFFHKPFQHRARFNHRLRTIGGRYILSSHHIEINPKYYEQFGEEELIEVIKHELCHYHLHLEGKGYRHRDRDFRELLKQVQAPRFCKPLSSSKLIKQHYYICSTCHFIYVRKRRVDTNRYVCGRCQGKLKKLNKAIDN
jgi:SprT-like protein